MKKILLSEGEYTLELENNDEPINWGAGFFDKENFSVLYIPEGATTIAERGFMYCNRLEKIYMPASVKNLGDNMFYGTYHCIEIYYGGTSEEFKKIGDARKVKKMVQVPGKYDVQPYCNTDGTYYEERWEWESFDSFCAECRVICADGVTLYYGYRKPE